MATFIRSLFIIFLVAVVGIAVAIFWNLENRLPTLSYNEFLASVERNEIVEVHLQGGKVTLTDIYNRRFSTFAPDVAGLLPRLVENKIAIYGSSDHPSPVWNLLSLSLPLILFLVLWFFLMKKNRPDRGEEPGDFAKDKAIRFASGGKHVTFRDVTGIPEVKEELLELVDFLQKPTKYSRLGATIPKGVLFQGPPGTGKTLLARAIAGEAGVPFFSISGSDFVEMFVGVGASRVRDLFREAKKIAPCIIFIDEIDAVGGHRGAAAVGGQEERGQTLNALLVEMDGFSSDDTVIVLAATNRPDILDPALMRPGRFDRIISILPPDVKGRQKILEVHTRNMKLAADVELEELARSAPGFTGAELASLVNEAALIAGRKGKKAVELNDFEAAKDRILMGVERKGLVISEKDRKTMAIHEAGHAVLTKFLPEVDPLHKITIIPRGKAMGHTQQLPLQDRHAYSKEYLRNRITILMGGRAAEELAFNQQTTGAEDDFKQAVLIATNMVCKWGMSEVIGPVACAKGEDGFLGGQATFTGYSEQTARFIDQEVRKLIEGCYREAVSLLTREKGFLFLLADALLLTETVDADEIAIIFECAQKKKSVQEGQEDGVARECELA